VDALRAHDAAGVVLNNCTGLLGTLALLSPATMAAARAAGGVEAVAAALESLPRCDLKHAPVDVSALASRILYALAALVSAPNAAPDEDTAAQDAAVRAGALEQAEAVAPAAQNGRLLQRALADAVQRHDAVPCAHAAVCKRCAAARARGEVCALPSCGARRSTAAATKKLSRCARCLTTAYCSAEHQKADWKARHKAQCRAPQAGGRASGSGAAP
jgi:hypothetical protein